MLMYCLGNRNWYINCKAGSLISARESAPYLFVIDNGEDGKTWDLAAT